jgi:glycosyltransferase involved in cell wall biosynthesis
MTPLISVKIPTYNCAEYLIQTIKSVLNQKEFDSDLLDIEVIDDCSTKDNPEEVVTRYGQGKVTFFRQSQNVGAVKNFNTCINRTSCEYLHILHGDDYLEDNFYKEIYNLIISRDANLYSTRCYIVNETSKILDNSSIINSTDLSNFIYQTPIQFANVIFKTKSAKTNGGFDESLIHLNDRDMWLRLSLESQWVHSNKILANYRFFEGNDSSKLIKTGQNIIDYHRFYNKHSDILNLSTMQIQNILFNIYLKQSLNLNSSDLKSNRLVMKSVLGISYYYFRLRSKLKSLFKK